jgi:hypothetical protein
MAVPTGCAKARCERRAGIEPSIIMSSRVTFFAIISAGKTKFK